MTIKNTTTVAPRFGIATLMSSFGPKPFLAPPNEDGTPTAEELAATAAAEAAAKAAADKAAADKAAADKAAAEKAEADRKAQEEAEKNMSETEREKQKLVREVMEKKGKLKDTEDSLSKANAELEKYKGLDIEKVKALLEAENKREEKELEQKGEYDRLKARIAQEREAEAQKHRDEKAALEAQIKALSGNVDDLTVGQNFAGSTYISEELILTPTKARALYGSHFEMKDGKTVAYDKPAGSAGRTMLVDAGGEPIPFDDAMRKIIDADPEKESILKAKINPGAHSKVTQTGTKSQQQNKEKESGLYGASRILAALNAEKK